MLYVASGSRTLGPTGKSDEEQWIVQIAKAASVLVQYLNDHGSQSDKLETIRWCNL